MSSSRYPVARVVGLSVLFLACLGVGWLVLNGPEIARSELDERLPEARGVSDTRPGRKVASLPTQELAEPRVVDSRLEVPAQVKPAESALDASMTEIGAYEYLLELIRKAAEGDKPHHVAWPHVRALTDMVAEQLSGAELSPVRLGLDAVLRASETESDFVRAAVLLALGMALPENEAEGLANEFALGATGELAQAAWFVLAVRQPTADSGPGGVDLGLFTPYDSQVSLETWPIVIPHPEDSSLLELGLPQLSPPSLYSRSKKLGDREANLLARQGTAKREVIILAAFAVRAQRPGLARDMMLGWMRSSDMSRVCIWSLCLAAKNDRGLAAILRDHLLILGLNTPAGQYLAEKLGGLAGRGDLVFDMLQSELLDPSEAEGILEELRDTQALFALGEIIASGQEELGEQATELLIEVVSSPTVIDSVRKLALLELAVARPDRVGDGIELVLTSEAGGDPRAMAASMARMVHVPDQQRMRDLLIASYSWVEGSSDVREAYVRSLIFLGGPDSVSFLRGLPLEDIADSQLARELEQYLSSH